MDYEFRFALFSNSDSLQFSINSVPNDSSLQRRFGLLDLESSYYASFEDNLFQRFFEETVGIFEVEDNLFQRFFEQTVGIFELEDNLFQRLFVQTVGISELEYKSVPDHITNSFPVMKLKQSKNEDCTICLDALKSNENVINLPCNHYYHEDCIKRWLNEQNFCPVCRTKCY